MGIIQYATDSLRNLVANLGTWRDKAAASEYGYTILTPEEALNAYRGAWLPRKIVDVPALDATRKWRSWNAEKDQITEIEAEETRLGLQGKVLDALKKARLFGGASIYLATGEPDPSKPLDPDRIQKQGIKQLVVLTRRVLQAGDMETDPESALYGRPKFYKLTGKTRQVDIDPSRLVIFQGAEHPDPEIGNEGWGDSILQATFEAIRNSDSTAANIASLVFEAKIDVIRIPGFMAGLQDKEYEQKVLDRLMLAARAKGINGALVLDKDEEYDQKSADFGELTNILMAFMQLVSGAADIPVTRLLGQSPAGLNSTGESDIRNYYDRISSMQTLTIQPAMAALDECLIRSALGSRPKEVFFTWRSLWQTTDKERADIGKTTAESIKTITETKLIPDEVMTKVAVNMLTEAGVAPGLESEMDAYVPDPEEEEAEAARAALGEGEGDDSQAAELGDASPRTLYVHRKVKNAAEIIAWAKGQGFETTLPAEDLHVTIAFSRTPVDWMKAGENWSSQEDGGLIIKPGGARLIEKFDGGAVVLLFNSSELAWRHCAIKEAGASWDWSDYQPHITITYEHGSVDLAKVEPYRGAIELGPEIFEELDEDWKNKVRET